MFLDDTWQTFSLDKKARGSSLLERVFDHLELGKREYFGLIFNDAGGTLPSGHAPGQRLYPDQPAYAHLQRQFPP